MTRSVDELWLGTLQKLASHVAHDLKGALNGASVNLEVVRSRSERESAGATEVHRFAVNAAEQLGVVIRVTGALLSLARGTRGPVEVSMVTKHVAALVDDLTAATGGRITVSVDGGMAAETAAPVSAVRLAIGETLLAVAAGGEPVTARVSSLPTPHVKIGPGAGQALPPEILTALVQHQIRIATDGHGISIWFPGPQLPH